VAASGRARRFLEAGYVRLADDESRTELLNLLSCLRTQYLGIADYESAIAAGKQIVTIMADTGIIARTKSHRDLGEALLLSGRREESLEEFRKAASVMDELPIEKQSSSLYRSDLAETYLYVVSRFTATRREDESLGVLKRVLPVAEALVRDNPANNQYRDTLFHVYRAAGTAFLGLGDLAAALDYEQKVLKLEPAPLSPTDVYDRALRLARTGSLEFLLGHREPGEADGAKLWRCSRRQRAVTSNGGLLISGTWQRWKP